jgi:hypothetical protein
MFKFVKRKYLFMKTYMTRDINTLRYEVKKTINKMRGAIS